MSLSTKGLTHGEICAHLVEIYGAQVSKQTISTITDQVMEGMVAWQNRPLDSVYLVIFIDCVNVMIRDGNMANQPIYVQSALLDELLEVLKGGLLRRWRTRSGRLGRCVVALLEYQHRGPASRGSASPRMGSRSRFAGTCATGSTYRDVEELLAERGVKVDH